MTASLANYKSKTKYRIYAKKAFISLYNKKEEDAAKVGVNSHPRRIVVIVLLLMAFIPFTSPTPTTAPTIADEVDTGMPSKEKKCIPTADDIWATKAPGISNGVMPLPTVSATFFP